MSHKEDPTLSGPPPLARLSYLMGTMGGKWVQTTPTLGSLASHTHTWDMRHRTQPWEMTVTSHLQEWGPRQVSAACIQEYRGTKVGTSPQTKPPLPSMRTPVHWLPTPLAWSGPPVPHTHAQTYTLACIEILKNTQPKLKNRHTSRSSELGADPQGHRFRKV